MSTHASGLNFCAFLRAEADAADDKARRLRIQAATLTQTAGLDIGKFPICGVGLSLGCEARSCVANNRLKSNRCWSRYLTHYPPLSSSPIAPSLPVKNLTADELAPLDEHGKPKYTGKKRGRKPKPKKRQRKLGAPKRKHTGYTLYMKENYPSVKMAMAGRVPEAQSKDVISSVATSWKSLSEEDRGAWKERARTMSAEEEDTAAAAAAAAEADPYHHDETAAAEYAVEHDM